LGSSFISLIYQLLPFCQFSCVELLPFFVLGRQYHSLEQYQKAIDSYQQSISIFKQVGDQNGEAAPLIGLAET
jgi:hypothetical protein